MVPLYRERAKNLIELARGFAMLLTPASGLVYDPTAVAKALTEDGRTYVRGLREALAGLTVFDNAAVDQAMHDYVEGNGLKFKQVAQPWRVALTGSTVGPGLSEAMTVLGKEETLARLDRALTL